MTYLIGLIPGAVAGIAIALLTSKAMKLSEEIKWMKGEIKAYPVILFFIVTFLFGPALTFVYSIKFEREGPSAFWYYAVSNTVNVSFMIVISYWINKKWGKYIRKKTGSWINKKIWRESLISFLIFIFALIWLLPLLYNWFMAGTLI